MSAAERLVAAWRDRAELLARYGAGEQAAALRACAAELEETQREESLETLTLRDAAKESGLTYSALEKGVRSGRIPNAGSKGRPRIRRGDLPRRPTAPARSIQPPDLAGRVLAGG